MPLRVISFKADEKLLEKIDKYSAELGLTRSEFIRMAVEKYIYLLGKLEEKKEKQIEEYEEEVIIIS
ncbi:MAG: CopG family transcriptional regulator [Thermoprotei archaeon]|nr:ribbon-helix-helix protein, CopG family [Staphylothermus sp.]RLG90440.1 MAG: CopG family transcriptional regulator [Thermoprotei archaeon]